MDKRYQQALLSITRDHMKKFKRKKKLKTAKQKSDLYGSSGISFSSTPSDAPT